jgi:hypothetical protein
MVVTTAATTATATAAVTTEAFRQRQICPRRPTEVAALPRHRRNFTRVKFYYLMDTPAVSHLRSLPLELLELTLANNSQQEVLNTYLAGDLTYSELQRFYLTKLRSWLADYPVALELLLSATSEVNYFLLYHLLEYYFKTLNQHESFRQLVAAAPQGILTPAQRRERINTLSQLTESYVAEYQDWSTNFDVELLQLTGLVIQLGASMGWSLEDRIELHQHYKLFADDHLRFGLLSQALTAYQEVKQPAAQVRSVPKVLQDLIESSLGTWPLRAELVDLLLKAIDLQQLLSSIRGMSNLRLFRVWLQRFAATQPTYSQVLQVFGDIRGGNWHYCWSAAVIEAFPLAQLPNQESTPEDVWKWCNLWFIMPSIRHYLIQRPLVDWTLINRPSQFFCSALGSNITTTTEQTIVVLEALLEQPLPVDLLPLEELIAALTTDWWSKCRPQTERVIQQALTIIQQTHQPLGYHCLSWPHEYFVQVVDRLPSQVQREAFHHVGMAYGSTEPSPSPHRVANLLWLLNESQVREELTDIIVAGAEFSYLTFDGLQVICTHPILRAKLFESLIPKLYRQAIQLETIWSCRQHIEPELMQRLGDLVDSTEDPKLLAVISSNE